MSLKFILLLMSVWILSSVGCSSIPTPHHTQYDFPKEDAFVGDVKDRPYTILGGVKSRVEFPTLSADFEEKDLCKNYYNDGVQKLVKSAKEKGADAVIDVRSVVFMEDGKSETYQTPECADDGAEGQILLQGIAVKWRPLDPALGSDLPDATVKDPKGWKPAAPSPADSPIR